jgi:hypothetical protein
MPGRPDRRSSGPASACRITPPRPGRNDPADRTGLSLTGNSKPSKPLDSTVVNRPRPGTCATMLALTSHYTATNGKHHRHAARSKLPTLCRPLRCGRPGGPPGGGGLPGGGASRGGSPRGRGLPWTAAPRKRAPRTRSSRKRASGTGPPQTRARDAAPGPGSPGPGLPRMGGRRRGRIRFR